jgi:hypothetical protein
MLTLSLSQRERENYGEMVLAQRLCDAQVRQASLGRGVDPLILSIGG